MPKMSVDEALRNLIGRDLAPGDHAQVQIGRNEAGGWYVVQEPRVVGECNVTVTTVLEAEADGTIAARARAALSQWEPPEDAANVRSYTTYDIWAELHETVTGESVEDRERAWPESVQDALEVRARAREELARLELPLLHADADKLRVAKRDLLKRILREE
jgi:hypothetical protein